MKLVLFYFTILNLFSCVFSRPVRESGFLTNPKSIVLVDNADDCRFMEVLSSTGDKWAENADDKVLSGVLHLKGLARERGANAISNVKLESLSKPNGNADGLICSVSKFEKYRNFQDDSDWIRRHILIEK